MTFDVQFHLILNRIYAWSDCSRLGSGHILFEAKSFKKTIIFRVKALFTACKMAIIYIMILAFSFSFLLFRKPVWWFI